MLPEKQGKTVQKKLLPRLRFPEFKNDGKWEVKRLGEVFIKINKLVEEDNTASYKPVAVGEKGLRLREEIFDKDLTKNVGKYKVFPFYSVCFGLGSKSLAVAVNDIENSYYCVSNAYKIYKVKNQVNIKLLKYYIELVRNKWGKKILIQSSRQGKSIDENILFDTAIPVPSLPEQQKIAACLSSLDDLITAERQKLELLKAHKKGLLQNLFPQEGETVPKLRFPEFKKDGEWEVKKLGEISENIMYGMNAAAVEFDGENKYIRITDIDENTRLFSPNPLTSPYGQLDDKYLLKVGDILFARTGASVGKSYLHQKENGRFYFAGFLIRFTIKNAIPYFVYLQTLTEQYQKWVSKTSMRSGQPGINAEQYKLFTIFIPPTIREQQKITACLLSLDDLITAQTQKIELLQQHKKGLLQGLFPKMEEN
ncbi:MAG: type I site-specific deoxyribonuclease specificity subunit [Bacteroidia bacterium]|nr:MAG: type I site-specific deoxyribonuclease specificity subunit [Bacteroidia bacterium]